MKQLVAAILMTAFTAYAQCCTRPNNGTERATCHLCGNLERNIHRDVELAYNRLQQSVAMQNELFSTGLPQLHLTNPAYSSPGVLWYTALIEDNGLEVVYNAAYEEMLQLERQREIRGESGGRSGKVSIEDPDEDGEFPEWEQEL